MVINSEILDGLQVEACNSERKRKAMLLHDSPLAPSQRMLNALEPGTQVPIHRHVSKDETYVLLRGNINVIFYNDSAEVVSTISLRKDADIQMLVIPKGQWHSVDVKVPSVIFEVCDGPYEPLQEKDILKK